MAIRIIFLGPLRDVAGSDERDLAGPLDWDGLVEALGAEFLWHLHSARVRIAVNGAVLADKESLVARDGDEIALLPPVSGG